MELVESTPQKVVSRVSTTFNIPQPSMAGSSGVMQPATKPNSLWTGLPLGLAGADLPALLPSNLPIFENSLKRLETSLPMTT